MKKTRAHRRLIKRHSSHAGEAFAESSRKKQALATLDLDLTCFEESDTPTSTRIRRARSPQCAPLAPPRSNSGDTVRVLLIENDDDEGSARDHLGEDFSVQQATSLNQACSALDGDHFDLVLLDIRLHDAAAMESIARLEEAAEDSAVASWNVGEGKGRADDGSIGVSGFLPRREAEDAPAHWLRLSLERHREHQQLKKLLETHPDGVLVLDGKNEVLFANQAVLELLGRPREALLGKVFPVPAQGMNETDIHVDLGGGRTAEVRMANIEWQERSCRLLGVRDVTDRQLAHQSIASLISELLTTNEKLVHQVSQDPLTGLLNRRGLHEALIDETARMHRTSSTLSAMLVDCDDFKGINDTLGYAMGDAALVAVANTLRATLRPQDRVGRVGGDEFLVLLPATRPAEATMVGRRFIEELSVVALPPALRDRKLTVSIGVDCAPRDAGTIEEVIAAVAAPLKVAKSRGKHRVTAAGHYANDLSYGDANEIAAVLSDARCLRVASQSIVRMADGVAVARELLVRGPRGDLESPSVLFALASSSNSLITFDLNCLRASMAMRARLQVATRCHVNVHPSTLIGAPIATVLDIVGREPGSHQLCIELSEQQLVGSPVRLRDARHALRAHGVGVALDHVGFGHSSLEALIVLEPDIVKIDRRFVHGVSKDAGMARDLRRLAGVLQGFGAEVIAEGVESLSDIDTLRLIGIELGQGYFWDKPSEAVPPPPNAGGSL